MPTEQQAPAGGGFIARLGELLGVRTDEVEAVLRHDEARARSTVQLQRRGFLGAAAALAAAPFVPKAFIEVADSDWLWPTAFQSSAWGFEFRARLGIDAVFNWVAINAAG